MLSNRHAVRLVLAIGVLGGLINGALFARGSPAQIGIATDVYYHAARAAIEGRDFYAVTPPDHGGFYFLYPPIVLLGFLPYGLLGDPTLAYAVQTAANLVTGLALGSVLVWTIGRYGDPLPRLDRWLVRAFALSTYTVASTFVMGQINLQLALGIAVGALLLERSRTGTEDPRDSTGGLVDATIGRVDPRRAEALAGVAFALVALVKLFPALVGAWLLRNRAWRAIGAAIVTGVGLLLAGVVIFGPEQSTTYVTGTLSRELSIATFADGPEPSSPYLTVRRQLGVLAPWLPDDWLLPAGIGVVSPVVLACYRTVADPRSRLVALTATLFGTLVLFPLEPFYLAIALFPTVALVYLVEPGLPRGLLLAGVLAIAFPVRFGSAEMWITRAPLSPAFEAVAMDAARSVYSFAMPTMVGVWAILASCVIVQHRAVRERREQTGREQEQAGSQREQAGSQRGQAGGQREQAGGQREQAGGHQEGVGR